MLEKIKNNQIFKLLMLQINAKYGKARSAHAGKYAWSIGRYLLILAIATIVFYSVLSYLIMLGMTSNIYLLSIGLLVTQAVGTIFAISAILSNLYFNKDNELLLVLPVSANQVFISKLLMVYVMELLITTMISFPVLAVIGFFARFDFQFYLLLPFSMLFLPLIPLGLGALLSVPISLLISFLKKHNIVAIIFVLVMVSTLLFLYISVMSGISSSFNIAADQIKYIITINSRVYNFGMNNRPYINVAYSLVYFRNFWILLLYIICGAALVLIAVAIVKPIYFHSIMKIAETGKKTQLIKGNYKVRSHFWSLVGKEFKDIFRSPNYVFQFFLFTLLMPIIVFCYDRLLLQLVVNDVGKGMIAGSHVLILAVITMLSNLMSSSAVSREGANFYLIKTVPVNYYIQSGAKIAFNAMFTGGAILLTAIVSSFYLNAGEVWFGSLAVFVASLAHICLSYDFDLKNPTLDWYDDSDITKMSKNTTKSLIVGMLMALVIGVIVIFTSKNPLNGIAIVLALSIILLGYSLYVLIMRIYYKYNETEV